MPSSVSRTGLVHQAARLRQTAHHYGHHRGPAGGSTTVRTILSEASSTNAPSSPIMRLLVQSINHTLLKPRVLRMPRWISPQHSSFTLSELFGHGSFIFVAASYYSQDFLELRIMAVAGSAAMLFFTYFHPHGRVLWLPLKWNALFIAINSYRIGKVYFDRYMAEHGVSEEMKAFRSEYLSVVNGVEFYRLLKIAREETFEEGDLIMHQTEANPYIRIVVEGEMEVLRDGTLTYVLERGNFVSESGLHAGLHLRGGIEACSTIVVAPPFDPTGSNNTKSARKNRVRCLRWDRSELMDLLESDKKLATELKAALSWDIVSKLKAQRQMLTEGRVKNPTAWTKKREDQGNSRYAAILQNMLANQEQFRDMSEVLTKYRKIHHIGDMDHERALARCGWTEEDFRLGKREVIDFDDDYYEEEEFFMQPQWRLAKRYSSKLVRSLLES